MPRDIDVSLHCSTSPEDGIVIDRDDATRETVHMMINGVIMTWIREWGKASEWWRMVELDEESLNAVMKSYSTRRDN